MQKIQVGDMVRVVGMSGTRYEKQVGVGKVTDIYEVSDNYIWRRHFTCYVVNGYTYFRNEVAPI